MGYIRAIRIFFFAIIVQSSLSLQSPRNKLKLDLQDQKQQNVPIDDTRLSAVDNEKSFNDESISGDNKTSEFYLHSSVSPKDGEAISAQDSQLINNEDQSTQTDASPSFKKFDIMPNDKEELNQEKAQVIVEQAIDDTLTPDPSEIARNLPESQSTDEPKSNAKKKIVRNQDEIVKAQDQQDFKRGPVPAPKLAEVIDKAGTSSTKDEHNESINKVVDNKKESPNGFSDVDFENDDSSSPTVVWFALFSVVTVVSVVIYVYRSGLRVPEALGLEPVSGLNHAEEIPLMPNIDHFVSSALLSLHVPSSAIERYLQAFHSRGITSIEQLDDNMWKELALPSAIELELKRRFQQARQKPRSPGLALQRGHASENGPRVAPNVDDIEFDDWSFDDEDINDEI